MTFSPAKCGDHWWNPQGTERIPDQHIDRHLASLRLSGNKVLWRDVQQSGGPSVAAGATITRGKVPSGMGGTGTAGLVVRKIGQSSGASVMTCAHVLGSPSPVPNPNPANDLVYSPALKTFLGLECNNPFGQVDPSNPQMPGGFAAPTLPAQLTIGQDSFGIDAALIQVANNATALNVIPKIGQIADTRDLVQEWNLSAATQDVSTFVPPTKIAVRKYGFATKYTEGTIVGLARQQVAGNAGAGALVLAIAADSTQPPFSQTYDLDINRFMEEAGNPIHSVEDALAAFTAPMTAIRVGSASGTSIQVQGPPSFSQQGDSGAPIVDSSNKIVGIVSSGTFVSLYVRGEQNAVLVNTGNSRAIFIAPALQSVNATFLQAGQQTAGPVVIVPGMMIAPGQQEISDSSDWERAWMNFTNTPAGQRLSDVIRRHFEEVSQLVHHNRRVKLAWHRNKGPAFAAALVRATRDRQWPMPKQIDDVRREDGIHAMREALMSSGSQALRAAIIEHGDDFTALLNDGPPVFVTTEKASDKEGAQ